MNGWNEKRDHQGKEIFNFSVAYERNNREPLYYEAYPGSIVDISQLKYTLEKAKGYGYYCIRKAKIIDLLSYNMTATKKSGSHVRKEKGKTKGL